MLLWDEMVSYIHTNLSVNVIVRLPHPRSRNSEDYKTFLALYVDIQTRGYELIVQTTIPKY